MMKQLNEISWNVTEEEYRNDKALSYSTLSRYTKLGFSNLDKLFDKIETPSLTFGSAVDSIITGGLNEFNNRFMVADFPSIPDTIISIVKTVFSKYNDTYISLNDIPDSNIIEVAAEFNYQNNWKPETRAKVIKEKGATYYNLLYISKDKTILDTETYVDVCKTVDALHDSPGSSFYFSKDSPFDSIKRYYQLKFKANLNGIDYRCMADLILVDYNKKTITPIDLKTSSKPEWEFYKSFIEYNYQIQARLYWRIIRDNLSRDPYFKDFTLLDYRFIVVNRKTLTPLSWKCDFTTKIGDIEFEHAILRDPEDIGKELTEYLTSNNKVPIGININETNSLSKWLNK